MFLGVDVTNLNGKIITLSFWGMLLFFLLIIGFFLTEVLNEFISSEWPVNDRGGKIVLSDKFSFCEWPVIDRGGRVLLLLLTSVKVFGAVSYRKLTSATVRLFFLHLFW